MNQCHCLEFSIHRDRHLDTTFDQAADELVWIDGTQVVSQSWMGNIGAEFNDNADCMYVQRNMAENNILHDRACSEKVWFLCQI